MSLGPAPSPETEAAAPIQIAILGNPNTGKTTLFNALTGLGRRVGNYPGVTVERWEGSTRIGSRTVTLLDLPGTYSLAAHTPDESIAVDVLLGQLEGERPVRAVVAIVDASNLERNLYLVSQLLELDIPVVIALNMIDVARQRGIRIDARALSDRLGVPVVPTRADRGEGVEELRRAIDDALATGPRAAASGPAWPGSVRREIERLRGYLDVQRGRLGRAVHRAEVLRLLVDAGGQTETRLAGQLGPGFNERLDEARMAATDSVPLTAMEADVRYRWIAEHMEHCVHQPEEPARTFSDRMDAVLTHRVAGTIVLAAVLALVFQAIYRGAVPVMEGMQFVLGGLGEAIDGAMSEGPLESLLVNGVVGGVGSVVVFLPQILLLFLFMAILEDCGYMARAAFLMDRVLSRVGLSGKSVIPLVSSFACAVPGIMAVRTIGNRRDRLATALVAPLMSCSARLPVYVLLIAAFVPSKTLAGGLVNLQGLVLFLAHLIGIVVAVPVLWFLRRTLLRGPTPPFVLELPAYRWPAPRVVVMQTLAQGREFLVRAGTVIFAASIVVWALSYYPHPSSIHERYESLRAKATSEAQIEALEQREAGEYLRHSVIGRLGRLIEPAVEPLGWDWRIGMAVVASFPARELVIATMGTIFNVGDDVDETSRDLTTVMTRATWPDGRLLFNLPVALSLIVFFALCCQCVSTLVVLYRETGSAFWPAFTFGYMTALAYLAALVTYQGARWLMS